MFFEEKKYLSFIQTEQNYVVWSSCWYLLLYLSSFSPSNLACYRLNQTFCRLYSLKISIFPFVNAWNLMSKICCLSSAQEKLWDTPGKCLHPPLLNTPVQKVPVLLSLKQLPRNLLDGVTWRKPYPRHIHTRVTHHFSEDWQIFIKHGKMTFKKSVWFDISDGEPLHSSSLFNVTQIEVWSGWYERKHVYSPWDFHAVC